MMIGGAILLLLSGAFGELHPFPHVSRSAALALSYLITCGSLLAFYSVCMAAGKNASPSKVSSYAYVNPVVAVAGWATSWLNDHDSRRDRSSSEF